ncbi:MAG: bifunctional DNA-formamidopyrimidine glycosylase/DNA-(apurinic or apyrimidinic site) lyase, partial [Chloroflexota bacterium]
MPELPEVETIRRDLHPSLVGRKITSAWISDNAPRLVQLLPPSEFERLLPGHTIEDVTRRGKYLILNLDRGMLWAVHLRMTGRFQHSDKECSGDAYLRAKFSLDDGTWLCFNDLRKFGMMWLVDDWALVNSDIGPEPLDEAFDVAAFAMLLKRRSAPIKSVLLDQTVLAGIGNIYADESLFLAGIDPRKSANKISKPKAANLHAAIVDVLQEALGDRGSSFSDYVDGKGNEGRHQLKVKVYQRTDQPCRTCGTPIRRVVVGGRSTHFCPKCQR